MKIGIVGLPNVGKSTLFQALTKKQVDTSNYPFATIDPNIGVISVPDERMDKLAEFSRSKKTIPAIVEFVDIAGLVRGASKDVGKGNAFLSHIKEVDAICHIVRAFKNDNIIHFEGKPDPASDMETITIELALKDLETVKRVKDKAAQEAKTGKKEAVENLKNIEDLENILNVTSHQEFRNVVRNASDSVLNIAQNNQLLSFKPELTVFNISSKDNIDISGLAGKNSIVIDIAQEKDISSMSDEERRELGIISELPKLIRASYELLGLITYFTTGEDETRAWTIPKDSKAPRAGRAIHSDFEEKFIRASVINWQMLLNTGSYAAAHERGSIRTEGKEYIVQDGDVIEFKI